MHLKFGIPTLDELIELPSQGRGSAAEPEHDNTSLSLLGPDGSGKSVLALHLASNYRSFCASQAKEGNSLPLIIYVSSDLQYESASMVWQNFGLDRPNTRNIPFERIHQEVVRRPPHGKPEPVVSLQQLTPGGKDARSEVKFLLEPPKVGRPDEPLLTTVGFLDLARYSAGDDWNYVNSLIVNLETVPRTVSGKDLNHLVIIDSVAGFETFMGKLDAYGMEQTRRARIAQCMRNAGTHAHLVFAVEEPDDGKRLPEEYVTDIVVRLRSGHEGGRPLRTVEVEKARARAHASGEHTFEIRSPNGSSTGDWENPDTPASTNAYVHVFHSLSHRNLRIAAHRGPGKQEKEEKNRAVTPFGLHYLDHLLEPGKTVRGCGAPNPSAWGIRAGSTAAIIGEPSTGKTVLAEKFIAEGFRGLVEDGLGIFLLLNGANSNRSVYRAAFNRVCGLLSQPVLGEISHSDQGGEVPETSWEVLRELLASWEAGDVKSADCLRELYKGSLKEQELDVQRRRDVLDDRKTGLERPFSRSNRRARRKNIENILKSVLPPMRSGPDGETPLHKCLVELFRHPNLRAPGIVLTNADRNVSVLAERCLGYFRDHIRDCLKRYIGESDTGPLAIEALEALKVILEEQLLVRRFDIDSMPASALFDMVQRNLIEAEYLLHGEYFPDQRERFPKADRIRLVIDDMRVIANLSPSVASDSAFLPFLVFHLEREGVTSLIVHSGSVRPGTRPEDPVSIELLSLLKQLILTWDVPFQGQRRIAVTAMPARSPDTNGLVREVQMKRLKIEREAPLFEIIKTDVPFLDITPNFELYSGLEQGTPRLVPLAVFLYAFTKSAREYMDREDLMFREQFSPIPGARGEESGRILWPLTAGEYYAIRDLTHLPWDAKALYTIVDQVDGFWSLDAETGALASQDEYLTRRLGKHDDPFNLFQGEPLHFDPEDKEPKNKEKETDNNWPARQYFFQNSRYRSRIVDFEKKDDSGLMPDRVPFTWDFGFILIPAGPWQAAEGTEVSFQLPVNRGSGGTLTAELQIPEIGMKPVPLNRLPDWFKIGMPVSRILKTLRFGKDLATEERAPVPWRLFFGACKVVADHARQERGVDPIGFDFESTSAETLASLVLEIWFSEITLACAQLQPNDARRARWAKWLKRLTSPVYEPLSRAEARPFSLTKLFDNTFADGLESPSFSEFRSDFVKNAQEWSKNVHSRIPYVSVVELVAAFEGDDGTFHERKKLFQSLPLPVLCLYKTWLLLLDVMDFAAVLDPDSAFEMKQPKEASPHAMAVRHYYRTACDAQARAVAHSTALRDPQIATGMPGNFSTRGDSFIASPKASRSRLLASHAMDLLCSRRANLTRLQMGIGLPVRDVLDKDACDRMRTALRVMTVDPSQKPDPVATPVAPRAVTQERRFVLAEMTYKDLCVLGSSDTPDEFTDAGLTSLGAESRRHWLFRNGIPEYDRVSRAMQKWLVRLFQWTVSYRARYPLGWDGGLKGYDALSVYRLGPLWAYESLDYFAELADQLLKDLEAAERRDSEN